RVSSRQLADSLFSLVNVDADFDLLAKKYSIYNPDDGGLSGTFTQNKDRARYDAAVNLDLGKISPVLSMEPGQYSIIKLVEKNTPKPLDFLRAYSRIESVLIKENQDAAKNRGVKDLLEKYEVQRFFNILRP
ncbi:uncharacterized protein METZ01_LOCUS398586, partial [marine metagenome]